MSVSLVSNTVLSSASAVTSAFAGFITNIVIARTLGADGAGLAAVLTWSAGFFCTVATLAGPTVLQRYIPELIAARRSGEAQQLAAAFCRASCFAGAITLMLAGFIFMSYADLPIRDQAPLILTLTGGYFVLQMFSTLYFGEARGSERFWEVTFLSVVTAVVQVFAVSVGTITSGIAGVLAGYILASALPAIRGIQLCRFAGGVPSELRIRVQRFAAFAWVETIVSTVVWSRSEVTTLLILSTAHDTGLFFAASAYSTAIGNIPLVLLGAFLPYLSRLVSIGERAQAQRVFQSVTLLITIVGTPLCLLAAGLSSFLIPIVFGSAFQEASSAAALLMLPAAISVAGGATSAVLYAHERGSLILTSNVVGLLLSGVLSLILIPRYGFFGAAVCRTLVQTLVVALETWFLINLVDFRLPSRVLGCVAVAAALAGAAAVIVAMVAGETFFSAAAAALVGLLMYTCMLRLLRVADHVRWAND